MINIKNISFDSWYNQLKNKQVIIPNKGIGDIIISSNYAKYAECGVLYFETFLDYRNKFIKEYCTAMNFPFYVMEEQKRSIVFNNNQYKKILQFNIPKLFNQENKDEKLSSIFMQNHGFVKTTDEKNVLICPMGSQDSKIENFKRHIFKNHLEKIIDLLLNKNFKVFLVGIEKDIKEYGFYKNTKWINTNHIIHDETTKEKIDIIKFMQFTMNATFTISAATFFPILSSMFNIPTLVMRRYDPFNHPMYESNNDFSNFFYNTKWYKSLRLVTYEEVYDHLNKIR